VATIVKPGGSLVATSVPAPAASLVLDHALVGSPGQGVRAGASATAGPHLVVGEGEAVQFSQAADQAHFHGRVEIAPGSVKAMLRPKSPANLMGAMLFVGTEGQPGVVTTVDLTVSLSTDEYGGVNLTKIAKQLDAYRSLHGKTAQVVIITIQPVPGGLMPVAEAGATWDIGAPTTRIAVDTQL
jgi:hypothetical protein